MSLPLYHMDLSDYNFWVTALSIVCTPIFWNLVVRLECRGHYLSRLFGTPQRAVVFFAVVIAVLGLYRDIRYGKLIKHQPHWYILQENSILWSGYGLVIIGTFLVFSSLKALGFYNTFFGDEFGVPCENVHNFPFNVFENPMYIGSTLNFFGSALVFASQPGLLLTILVAVTYSVVGYYEKSFRQDLQSRRSPIKEKLS